MVKCVRHMSEHQQWPKTGSESTCEGAGRKEVPLLVYSVRKQHC